MKWGCFFMLPPLNCICHYKLRRDIKSDHGIDQGGCIRDALAVSFCACCALIQDWLDFLVYNIVQIQRGDRVASRNLRAIGLVLEHCWWQNCHPNVLNDAVLSPPSITPWKGVSSETQMPKNLSGFKTWILKDMIILMLRWHLLIDLVRCFLILLTLNSNHVSLLDKPYFEYGRNHHMILYGSIVIWYNLYRNGLFRNTRPSSLGDQMRVAPSSRLPIQPDEM